MSPELWVAIITLIVDVGILWILIEEFNFDKVAYEKEQYKKRMRKLKFEQLTTGEMK